MANRLLYIVILGYTVLQILLDKHYNHNYTLYCQSIMGFILFKQNHTNTILIYK